MKNGYYTFLLIALLVFMVPVAATAISFPHNITNGYGCSACHKSHSTLGTSGYNNLCTSCHFPSDPKAGGKPFYQTDPASPFGTVQSRYSGGVIPSKIYQTSHNWTGSDVNPSVGSSSPTGIYVNNPYVQGTILCVRCHSVHGYRESPSNSAPFLRGLNDKGQMCVDCHKIRNTVTHMTGSHPVNVNYSSMAKSNPTGFYPSPVNANPANPTSAMKLAPDGTVQCTSCHAVHYSDSRRSTVDGAASYNQLSTSKGFLLRTDARGKTATDINICTNCHAGKAAHNGKGQNIQCNDCHSGHVEYDKNSITADEKIPNKYVVRRYMNISTQYGAIRNVRTFFRYTGSQKEYYRGAVPANGALGICQSCHYDNANFKSGHYVDPNDPTKGIVSSRQQCANCHNHKSAFGCSACHGFPPKKNQSGTDGFAVYTGKALYSTLVDESITPHATHADGNLYKFDCTQCHKGNTAHNTGNFRQVFRDKTNIIAGTLATYSSAASRYDCSNMYCHSNAQTTPAYKVVNWKNTKNTIVKGPNRCQSCHGDKNSIVATPASLSGVHQRHAASTGINYACQNCHAKTLKAYAFANNTGLIYPSTSHVNGVKNVSYSFSDSANAGLLTKVTDSILPYNNAQTCNTIYCHSNGAGRPSKVVPNWNDPTTGKCGTCHGVLGPITTTTFGIISSNAHFKHLSSSYGPQFITAGAPIACQNCHYSFVAETTHVDGNKTPDQTAATKCYKCHGGLQQGPLPTWSDKTRISCARCHPIWGGYSAARIGTVLAPKQVNYSTSGHGKRAAPYNKMACTACHDQNSAHISNPPLLGDNKRLIAVNYTGARNGGGGNNAVCGKCHWAGQSAQNKLVFTHVTSLGEAKNGKPTMACSRCHSVHGPFNNTLGKPNSRMLNNTIVFNPNSSAYPIVYQSPYSSVGSSKVTKPGPYNFIQTVAPYRGVCQVCHTKTMHFQRGRNEATDGPLKGATNTNTGGLILSHRSMNEGVNCLGCHPHNPPPTSPGKYGFYPYGVCDACHGYPPVPKSYVPRQNNYSSGKFENYTGGGGSHIVAGHVPASAKPSQGWDLCGSCHNENDHLSVPTYPQVKVSINDSLKFNSTVQQKYSSNRLDAGAHITGTCYNVSCHFQRTPKWGKP